MSLLILILIILIITGLFPLSYYLIGAMYQQGRTDDDTLDGELAREQPSAPPYYWWEKRRGLFNRGLLAAGIASFVLHAWLRAKLKLLASPFDAHLLISGLFLLAIYIVFMGIANVFYNLGALTEALVQPADLYRWRRRMFTALFWAALLTPLILPFFFTGNR